MRLIDADEFRKRINHYPPEIRDIAKKELRYTHTIEERKTGRFTEEEIKTIRIHMNAFKERLCNQCRYKEAEEYQQIVDKLDDMMEVEHDGR